MSAAMGTEARQVGTWNVRARKGQQFTRTLRFRNKLTRRPINLTGYTAQLSVRDAVGTEVLLLTIGNSRVTMGGTAGTIVLTVTSSAMDAVAASEEGTPYHHYLEVIDGSGQVIYVLQGYWVHEAKS